MQIISGITYPVNINGRKYNLLPCTVNYMSKMANTDYKDLNVIDKIVYDILNNNDENKSTVKRILHIKTFTHSFVAKKIMPLQKADIINDYFNWMIGQKKN